jgi:hypothetical protein
MKYKVGDRVRVIWKHHTIEEMQQMYGKYYRIKSVKDHGYKLEGWWYSEDQITGERMEKLQAIKELLDE